MLVEGIGVINAVLVNLTARLGEDPQADVYANRKLSPAPAATFEV
jgi:hypothetical protein